MVIETAHPLLSRYSCVGNRTQHPEERTFVVGEDPRDAQWLIVLERNHGIPQDILNSFPNYSPANPLALCEECARFLLGALPEDQREFLEECCWYEGREYTSTPRQSQGVLTMRGGEE